MPKENTKKAVKKQTQNTTAKKPVEKNKKTYEAKVEAKRSAKNLDAKKTAKKVEPKVEEVKVEQTMSNEMIDTKKDDKIWVVIAALLILLIGGAFVANKIVNTKKEEVENKIYTSKTITENNDGSVTVKVKIKSDIAIKTVTLEDGTVMNYNGKKEVEVKFTARENKEYKIIVKDENGKKTTKKVKVTGVKKIEEEVVLEVVEQKPVITYYYKPAPKPVTKPEEIKAPVIEGIVDKTLTNEDVELTISGTEISISITKDGVEIDNTTKFTEDGEYVVKVVDKNKQEATISFEIDKTAPTFPNINEEYFEIASIIAEDKNLDKYEVIFNNYTNTVTDEEVTIQGFGEYTIKAYDLAGNVNEKTIKVQTIFNQHINGMILNKAISLNYNTQKFELVKVQKANENSIYEDYAYNLGDLIEDSGMYIVTSKNTETNEEYQVAFVIDYTAPEINFSEEEGNINIQVEDTISGLLETYYGYSKNKDTEPTEEEYKKFEDGQVLETPTEDGEYYLWVKATDNAGNTTEKVHEEAIIVDNKENEALALTEEVEEEVDNNDEQEQEELIQQDTNNTIE